MTVSILGVVVYCVKVCEYLHFSLFMIQAIAGCIQAAFSAPILVISLNHLCKCSCCCLSLQKDDLWHSYFNEYARNADSFQREKNSKIFQGNFEDLISYQKMAHMRTEEMMKEDNFVLDEDDIENGLKEIHQIFKLESPVRHHIHNKV